MQWCTSLWIRNHKEVLQSTFNMSCFKSSGGCVLLSTWFLILRSENFKPRSQNRIMVPLRGFFENFRRAFPSVIQGSYPPRDRKISVTSNWRRNERGVYISRRFWFKTSILILLAILFCYSSLTVACASAFNTLWLLTTFKGEVTPNGFSWLQPGNNPRRKKYE